MDPKDDGAAAGKPVLTARDSEVLVAAFLSLSEPPKLDMTKFIKYSGFANLNSANANWARLKRKVTEMGGENGLNMTVATAPPRSTPKRKMPATANPDGAAENDATPSKKPRAAPKKTTQARAPAAAFATSENVAEEATEEAME